MLSVLPLKVFSLRCQQLLLKIFRPQIVGITEDPDHFSGGKVQLDHCVLVSAGQQDSVALAVIFNGVSVEPVCSAAAVIDIGNMLARTIVVSYIEIGVQVPGTHDFTVAAADLVESILHYGSIYVVCKYQKIPVIHFSYIMVIPINEIFVNDAASEIHFEESILVVRTKAFIIADKKVSILQRQEISGRTNPLVV